MRVLMLDIDGLQPAYLGPYGCEWVETPTLDAWAAAGVVFDQHFAECPDPAAGPSWRTGVHPMSAERGGPDLLADLRSAGVRTAIVGPGPSTEGWDITVPAERDADPLALKTVRRAMREAMDKLDDAENALLRIEINALLPPWRPAKRFLLDLFAVDSDDDEPADPPEPWTEDLPEWIAFDDDMAFDRLQRTYAAAVATLDESLAKMLADCAKRGWDDDAFWLLTANRAFPLGEHGPVGFTAADLHEELVHLPLMVRWPNSEHAGFRSSAFTQPMDLAPTIRELFGLPVTTTDGPWNGRSLTALARGGEMHIRDRVVTGLRQAGHTRWGYRSRGWYLMLDGAADGKRRLFVKPDDRWEVNDVEARNQELAEEMEREFRDQLK